MKKHPKAVLLFGKAGAQVGTAVALVETKSKIKVLDAVSVNVYGGKELKTNKSTVGIGIEKNVVNVKDIVKIGLGIYATERVENLFVKKPNISLSFGISGSF